MVVVPTFCAARFLLQLVKIYFCLFIINFFLSPFFIVLFVLLPLLGACFGV